MPELKKNSKTTQVCAEAPCNGALDPKTIHVPMSDSNT